MPHTRFRFFSTAFGPSALRDWLSSRRPRNPMLRACLGALGLAVLLVMVVLGAVIGTLMLLGGLAWRLLGSRGKPQVARPGEHVLDGHYRVLGKAVLPRGR